MRIQFPAFAARHKLVLTGLVSLLLVACSDDTAQEAAPQRIQAVKLMPVIDSNNVVDRTFPAEVSAVKTVNLSFEVSGRLIKTELVTGTEVSKGQVLAQIDPTSFKQRVQEAETRLKQASRDLKRVKATAKNGLLSQSQLDDAETNFDLATVALKRAQEELSYTTLSAPFNAQIAERFAERGNYVQAGDVVANLQDVSLYYFNVNIPEKLVSKYQGSHLLKAQAEIVSAPEKNFELVYVEHATRPDPVTQTYKVVFATEPENIKLTPGARAIVKVSFESNAEKSSLLIPFNALQGNDAEGFHVWKFDPATSQVVKAAVEVKAIENNWASITAGVSEGDLVVAAGASQMHEGLTVKPYQAEL